MHLGCISVSNAPIEPSKRPQAAALNSNQSWSHIYINLLMKYTQLVPPGLRRISFTGMFYYRSAGNWVIVVV